MKINTNDPAWNKHLFQAVEDYLKVNGKRLKDWDCHTVPWTKVNNLRNRTATGVTVATQSIADHIGVSLVSEPLETQIFNLMGFACLVDGVCYYPSKKHLKVKVHIDRYTMVNGVQVQMLVVSNLPPHIKGVKYIVPKDVAMRLPSRTDLLAFINNVEGQDAALVQFETEVN